jgi:hypothetical protein
LVIAKEPQVLAVAAKAPEGILFRIEPVLQRSGGGAAAVM